MKKYTRGILCEQEFKKKAVLTEFHVVTGHVTFQLHQRKQAALENNQTGGQRSPL